MVVKRAESELAWGSSSLRAGEREGRNGKYEQNLLAKDSRELMDVHSNETSTEAVPHAQASDEVGELDRVGRSVEGVPHAGGERRRDGEAHKFAASGQVGQRVRSGSLLLIAKGRLEVGLT